MYYQKYTPRFIWVFLALGIFSLLAYAFRFYFVFADHEQLRFGYSLWGVRTNLTEINQIIEEITIRWIQWRGQG